MTDSGQEHVPLLVFRLAEQHYGLHIAHVVEVAAMVALTTVPESPEPLLGIANRHGDILPVLDLRIIFAADAVPVTTDTLFVVVEYGNHMAGLVVDEVDGVRYLPQQSIRRSMTGPLVREMVNDGSDLIEIIALDSLFERYPVSDVDAANQHRPEL